VRALVIERFGQEPVLCHRPEPSAPPGGVVVRVEVTGLCRSDWHAFMGHDDDVAPPIVPGHEFAGTVHAVGPGVTGVRVGDRVTAPFVYACGGCGPCRAGDQQVCRRQEQPGFTRDGSFAELVVVENAAVNLVPLPDDVGTEVAAVLGCRFATSFRAVTTVGAVRPGEWVAVHGCGGVGLSAVMVAVAAGARVLAVDVSTDALDLALELGAERTVTVAGLDVPGEGHAHADIRVGEMIRELTGGGVHVSLDALGSHSTCAASIASLRTRGRHVQVGLLPPALGLPAVPMHLVVARELQVLGSHGMAAHAYPEMLALVSSGKLAPGRLVTSRIDLAAAAPALASMDTAPRTGVTLISP
jgi:alcohol dehydrogenase